MKTLQIACALALFLAAVLPTSLVSAQESTRPSAMKLFPAETLALLRVAHGREVFERFQQTGGGRMLSDPEIQPLVGEIWNFAETEYQNNVSEEAGFDWQDFSRLPKGEIAVAVVARGISRPGFLMLADFDGEQDDADFLLDRLHERWEAEGMVVEETPLDGETLVMVRRGDNRENSIGYVLKDACLVASNDETLLQQVLDRWAGRQPVVGEPADAEEGEPLPGEKTLADKAEFVSILRECSTQLEEPPQIVFYADPIGLARNLGRGNAGVSVGLAMLPSLGLDAVMGVGGTVSLATDQWDSLIHLHLLLDNPRSGVLTLLRFKQGDITPPSFVPDNVTRYSTLYLDAPGVFERLTQLIDQFRYVGSVREGIENGPSAALGIDFEEEFINNLAGRVIFLQGFDEPRRLQGGMMTAALSVEDPEVTQKALDTILERFEERIEAKEFEGATYYAITPFNAERPPEQRPFNPGFCLIDDTLIISMSTSVIEQMLAAHAGSAPRLADSEAYQEVQRRVERLTQGRELASFAYDNPTETFRHFYELAQDPQVQEFLGQARDGAPNAGGILDQLNPEALPPFEVIAQYLTPTGSYLLDTNTGLHFMMFNSRTE